MSSQEWGMIVSARRSLLVVGLVVSVLLSVAMVRTPAGASGPGPCPDETSDAGFVTNVGSVACYFSPFVAQYGSYTEYNNTAMASPTGAEFIAGDVWSWTACDFSRWVEQGFARGDGIHPTSGYVFFTGYGAPELAGGFHEDTMPASADGSHHDYYNKYIGDYPAGNGIWQLRRNGVVIQTYGLQSSGGACMSGSGLEAGVAEILGTPEPLAAQTAPIVNFGPLYWYDSSYTAHQGWSTGEWSVDYQCVFFGQTNCLLGSYAGAAHWNAGKV